VSKKKQSPKPKAVARKEKVDILSQQEQILCAILDLKSGIDKLTNIIVEMKASTPDVTTGTVHVSVGEKPVEMETLRTGHDQEKLDKMVNNVRSLILNLETKYKIKLPTHKGTVTNLTPTAVKRLHKAIGGFVPLNPTPEQENAVIQRIYENSEKVQKAKRERARVAFERYNKGHPVVDTSVDTRREMPIVLNRAPKKKKKAKK
jgi:hypothetical protein